MIDIIIVNWNSGRLLGECIESIEKYGDGLVGKVIVVDNGSSDGSADGLDDYEGVSVEVVRCGENLGFAKACNIGSKEGSSPFILFLNPDARIKKGVLYKSLSYFRDGKYGDVGVVGVQMIDENGAVHRSCAYSPTFFRLIVHSLGMDRFPGMRGRGIRMIDWDHMGTREVDHVVGAFYMIKREIYEKIGGFDERFFVYLEDVDLSSRVRGSGHSILFVSDVRVFHIGGGVSRQVKANRLFYSLRSRLQYGEKYFPGWRAKFLTFLMFSVEPVVRIAHCILLRRPSDVRHIMSAYRMLWRDFLVGKC